MKIEKSMIKKNIIFGLRNIDPIAVCFEDINPGVCKITITCFNKAWTYTWASIGKNEKAKHFFARCDNQYLFKKMSSDNISEIDFSKVKQATIERILKNRKEHGYQEEFSAMNTRDMYTVAKKMRQPESLDEIDKKLMNMVFGDEWYEYLPTRKTAEYEHLCRIFDIIKYAISVNSI